MSHENSGFEFYETATQKSIETAAAQWEQGEHELALVTATIATATAHLAVGAAILQAHGQGRQR